MIQRLNSRQSALHPWKESGISKNPKESAFVCKSVLIRRLWWAGMATFSPHAHRCALFSLNIPTWWCQVADHALHLPPLWPLTIYGTLRKKNVNGGPIDQSGRRTVEKFRKLDGAAVELQWPVEEKYCHLRSGPKTKFGGKNWQSGGKNMLSTAHTGVQLFSVTDPLARTRSFCRGLNYWRH